MVRAGHTALETNATIVGKRKRYFTLMSGAAVVLISLIFATSYLFDSGSNSADDQSAAKPDLKFTRLTPDLNLSNARFSSDGKYLVYTLLEKARHSVWMKDLTTGAVTQLHPPVDRSLYGYVVSRDGYFYFADARPGAPNFTLVRVPLAGGKEQIIAVDLISPIDLSPDEKQIAFVSGGDGALMTVTADGSAPARVLSQRDRKTASYESWGSQLSWSPDGTSIAICGTKIKDGRSVPELVEVSVTDGTEKTIPTPAWNYLDDVGWLSDRSALMVVARETAASPFQIWRVAYPTGITTRVTRDTIDYIDITVSADSRQLGAVQRLGNFNLWLSPFDDISNAKQITTGGAARDGFWGMAFTPDGKIIYTSPRGGNLDLWQTDATGEQKQLTKNAGDWNSKPRVTSEGRYIVFVSTRSGTREIWRMEPDGGNPTQLTNENAVDDPELSPDGKEVYFTVNAGDKNYIAKTSIDGGPAARVALPTDDSSAPIISANGKMLLFGYYDAGSKSPWKNAVVNLDTGETIRIFESFLGGSAVWAADSRSIIFSLQERPNLYRISIDAGSTPEPITNYESGAIKSFAVSPDFRQLAISRGNPSREAVLLENF
jgi:Tol biopolymer transport system component